MEQLKIGKYSRAELCDIFNLETDNKHFAEKVKNKLTNWGYTFIYSRKGVEITRKPETAVERLSELLVRCFKLDIQVEIYEFAIFFTCLVNDIDGFASMPWKERSKYLEDVFSVKVNEKTLRKWGSKLINENILVKSATDKTYWTTDYKGEREQIEADNPERLSYWADFWKMKEAGVEDVNKKLWQSYGCCFYSCPKFLVGAFADLVDIQQITELTQEIVNNGYIETAVVVETRIVEVKRNEFRF